MINTKPCFDIKYIKFSAKENNKEWMGIYKSYNLFSALQPIFSLSHKRIIGYEGLLRAKNQDNQPVSPLDLFLLEKNQEEIIFLDRLCRYIHIGNFIRLNDNLNWLFLNVSPYIMSYGKEYGSFFNDLLNHFLLPSYQIVIEIVEDPIINKNLFIETVKYYKELGCLIALDDFGKGDSNFERIWDFQPQIVKLDRSIILRASEQKKIRKLLPSIVSLIHQAGSLVLIEGIETEYQSMIAMESDVDFVQGYFFAKPIRFNEINSIQWPSFRTLFEKYKTTYVCNSKQINHIRFNYTQLFQKTINLLRQGISLKNACKEILDNSLVLRCYLLLENGFQIESTIVSENNQQIDMRFKPLEDAKNADWCRRHYFKMAVSNPDQLQISQPYFSITGAHMCITLSFMFSTSSGNHIFCCDLKYE